MGAHCVSSNLIIIPIDRVTSRDRPRIDLIAGHFRSFSNTRACSTSQLFLELRFINREFERIPREASNDGRKLTN